MNKSLYDNGVLAMDGIIVVNKPIKISSHDVVAKIRKILNVKKVGHTGTLDPMASGVLVVCVGNATKLSNYLMSDNKTYFATILLGHSTTTYDVEGEILGSLEIEPNSFNENDFAQTILSFKGKSMQTPPMYSAIKKDGKKLYQYALKGENIDIEPREIEVFSIRKIGNIRYENKKAYLDIEVCVSKGTYIRSLANDLGKKLNIPSSLDALVRIENGGYSINEASSLDDIMQGNFKLISPLNALKKMPKIYDDERLIKQARNGMKISFKYVLDKYQIDSKKIVIASNNQLVAIYSLVEEENKIFYKAERVWN